MRRDAPVSTGIASSAWASAARARPSPTRAAFRIGHGADLPVFDGTRVDFPARRFVQGEGVVAGGVQFHFFRAFPLRGHGIGGKDGEGKNHRDQDGRDPGRHRSPPREPISFGRLIDHGEIHYPTSSAKGSGLDGTGVNTIIMDERWKKASGRGKTLRVSVIPLHCEAGSPVFTAKWVPRTPIEAVGVSNRTDSGASLPMRPER